MEIRIRPAIESDARGIMEIYNYSIVVERNATFDTIPKTLEDRTQWIRSQGDRYPIVVAELNDQIIGWASVSSYRTRECYQGVGEFSVYVHKDFRKQNLGYKLLDQLIKVCKDAGYWKLLSRIFTFNQGSRKLCERCGFREVGIYEKHAKLGDDWLDVVIVEKIISENLI
ncbi:arsinothricin resistance N-acetyltransferase ArsN1 (plasmid) [Paenibacillus urinalis]|uniref:Arsinothricin resistance N-acetyltransferase ArsN1 n=1 Tax=Paenibacillus urinalis TaxID=521520 RepID=A0AAX3N6Y1_9BACL|nr:MULTISPECIES: arsinothricin resistance N-acetyltransferase ArsN1 family A [Paenibacillus]MCM3131045.1 arsinothricin resistance N-acetyltransferase ArsN1 [Paenibacillus sp. MER 78]WDH85367.1 arsinothricin resistance N-acetyltransferase ArsN1 [Paenibacillus urinalis]WDH95195.1 arsinothricin resistance N-acetyltransferase ArsN1 [Paenibacillus urinalis]WDI05331.1 arsinothricin resistance N-acetyltransferase ArsN1 [Paenibacillus urinalis]